MFLNKYQLLITRSFSRVAVTALAPSAASTHATPAKNEIIYNVLRKINSVGTSLYFMFLFNICSATRAPIL